ncbi:MAG: hypothetical protein WD032_08865 [Nitrospirales bacterium]
MRIDHRRFDNLLSPGRTRMVSSVIIVSPLSIQLRGIPGTSSAPWECHDQHGPACVTVRGILEYPANYVKEFCW